MSCRSRRFQGQAPEEDSLGCCFIGQEPIQHRTAVASPKNQLSRLPGFAAPQLLQQNVGAHIDLWGDAAMTECHTIQEPCHYTEDMT